MVAVWGPPHYKCIIQPPQKREIGVETARGLMSGNTFQVPVALVGPDLTDEEFTALSLKLEDGTYEAAMFLKERNWSLYHAHNLLCVLGARVQ